jgi:bidirectional [NiFe] hydrogenase diaphorase subunit
MLWVSRMPSRPTSEHVNRVAAVCASVTPPIEQLQAPSDDKRWRIVETRMRRLGNEPDALVEALHSAQEAFGYLETDALTYVGRSLSVPPSTVYGVATFYHYFTLKPAGEHTAVVCTGTACYINGASGILAAIRERLAIGPKQTTADGKVSLLTARCLGACSLAPAAIVDGEVEGRVNGPALVDRLEQL